MNNRVGGSFDDFFDDEYEPEASAETDKESLELEFLMVQAMVNQLKSIVADQEHLAPSVVEMQLIKAQLIKAQTLQHLAQTALMLTDATTVLIPRHKLQKLLDTAKLENSLKREAGRHERNSNT